MSLNPLFDQGFSAERGNRREFPGDSLSILFARHDQASLTTQ